MREPTGKHRYRAERRLFREPVLVLQLEEKVNEMDLVGGWPERVDYTHWRDAKVTDLPALNPQTPQ
jgi:hypothetical protein